MKAIQKIIILLFTLHFSVVFGQTKEEKIKDIKEKFQQINQDTYELKSLENEQFMEQMTDGGGGLTGYFKDQKICKIVERIGVSYCVRNYEYYFRNEQLIFVYEQELDFQLNDTGYDYQKQTRSFEGRYYFDKGKLIEIETTGKKAIEYDKDENKESVLLAQAKRYVALLKK